MTKRNTWEGSCAICGVKVRALEGVIQALDPGKGYELLCVEHARAGALDPPAPPEASKLPSIYDGDERYER